MAVVTEDAALPTYTANDLITRAYRILGDIAPGEALTAAQAGVGLEALNALLDSLSIDKLAVYEIRQEALSWPASTASQTIGDGATLDTHRPTRIEPGSFFRDSNNIDYPVKIISNRSVYDAFPDKTIETSIPEYIFYNPSVSWGTLYAYPVPNQALTLYLNSWMPLTVFDTLTEAHILPPGYQRMIAYNLAKELEAETGLPMPMGARQIASESLALVKRHNNKPVYSCTDSFYAIKGRHQRDIESGE